MYPSLPCREAHSFRHSSENRHDHLSGLAKQIITAVAVVLLTLWSFPALAAVGTNPASGNPLDYVGGNWEGSGDPDQLTNDAGATVDGRIYGNPNTDATGYSGGSNTIVNAGTVNTSIYGSYNQAGGVSGGGNTIDNSGNVNLKIYGSDNRGNGSSGGGNNISNSGDVLLDIIGSQNVGENSSGGGNIIKNSGTAGAIRGDYSHGENARGGGNTIANSGTVNGLVIGAENGGAGSSGGSNTITNTATGTVDDYICGSYNWGENSEGGSNTINNSGLAKDSVYGSRNTGAGSSGGSNTITNSGTVNSDIFGSVNSGDGSSGGGNTIINYGTITGGTDIYGDSNSRNTTGGGNTIINYNTVTDDIYGSYNHSQYISAGGNTIINYGRVGSDTKANNHILGSYNDLDSTGGSNIIHNYGSVDDNIYGSQNIGERSSGGSNSITNSGTVGSSIYGSRNSGDNSSGGSNSITNQSGGSADYIFGSNNSGSGTSGGSNTITNNGTVDGNIYGSNNLGDGSSGGSNTITNQIGGIADSIYGSFSVGDGSSGGENTITSSGTVDNHLYGSVNFGSGSSGGSNTVINTGTVLNIQGSQNAGVNSSGGSNTITNSGSVTKHIAGSYNWDDGSSGGANTIINSGTANALVGTWNYFAGTSGGGNTITNSGTVLSEITGTRNKRANTSGGSNTITNSGTVANIYGSKNVGDGSSGGGNTITNNGTVTGDFCGTYNEGDNTSGGGNTITNNGTVTGDFCGTLNSGAGASSGGAGNTIYNNGTVGCGIYAGDANDTVHILSSSNVGGVVDGQTGTDTLYFGASGVISSGDFVAKYLNFENMGLNVDGNTTLTGNWVFNLGATVVAGGTLNMNGSMSGTTLDNAGTANISGSASVGGATTNSGSLNVTGTLSTGSLNNSGSASISGTAYVGTGTTNSGSLNVNGTLTTASLNNTGTISGTGTIHADITSTGTISPGNSIGTLTVASSLTFESGSVLAAELDCSCSCDLIEVSGAVAIHGGTISTDLPQDLYADNTCWKIITAGGGITGMFDDIVGQPDSAVLSFSQYNSGDTLRLVLNRKSYGDFATGGAADTGRGLDALVPLATGDMEMLLMAMDYNLTADQITGVLDALNPEMYTAFSAASLKAGGLFDGAMDRRLEELRQRRAYSLDQRQALSGLVRVASAETVPLGPIEQGTSSGWSLWGRGIGLWADRDAADGYLGRGQTTGGAALGADYVVSDWLALGLATGATRTDVSWSRGNYDGDIDAVHTGFYAQAGYEGFFARLLASYARLQNSATRPVNLEGYNVTARSDFDADLYAAGMAVGYQARYEAWLFEPLASLDYQHLSEDGFSEGGAGFLDLDVADRDTDSFLFNLGIRATRLILADGWEVLPRLGIAWQHQLGDDNPSLDASFAGYGSVPFTVNGADFISDVAVAELGLTASMNSGLELFIDYRLAFADDYLAQVLGAGVMYSF